MKGNSPLFFIALGIFGIINTEFGAVGILPMVMKMYNVAAAQAGMLVSTFALKVFLGVSMGMVLGIPITAYIANQFSLGTSFLPLLSLESPSKKPGISPLYTMDKMSLSVRGTSDLRTKID